MAPLADFDIQPKPFQREMLADLERERENGRNRNLLVAATGTGKTVVAALDYRATCQRLGHRPRLLFVAHRAQILRQALRTFREVLRDHSFGELLSGGLEPVHHDHLFATIDSLTTRRLVERLGADFWHTVVIDECHRLAATRFRQLATTIQPAQLLGLTATPERSDGVSIQEFFTPRPDRSPAVELRLWDALDMQLLAPFEYYACDDETDFSGVPWDRPGETAAIESQYNEGVDIPEVDTLILLRPTQSPVLFQQQIGRGLRLLPGKESCLVLDFVGHHRVDFRFDRLLSAITGLSRNRLIESVEHGFTDLAPGCHIQLQRQTREQVLRSLRTLTQQSWRRFVSSRCTIAGLS